MPVRVTKKKTTIPYHAHTEFNELQYIFPLLNYFGVCPVRPSFLVRFIAQA